MSEDVIDLIKLSTRDQLHYIKKGIEYSGETRVLRVNHSMIPYYNSLWFDKSTLKLHHATLPAVKRHGGLWTYLNQGKAHRLDGPYYGFGRSGMLYAINGKIFSSKEEWEIEKHCLKHPELLAFT